MSVSANNTLAIILPAYKTRFLRATLASIAAQTDKNFQLYVFDDGSPEDIGKIVREFSAQLPLKFHRFEDNLGYASLVQHWVRCIRMTDEPWIWLFADDDLMEPGCVADFHAERERTQSAHELYRFNTVWVNSDGVRIRECPKHPVEESGAEFLLARLDSRRDINLQEQIFSRAAWKANGGIPEFPMGWHSDDTFCACLGTRRPLRLIPGARVNWRVSDYNISGDNSYAVVNQKIIISTGYFRWVMKFFAAHAPELAGEAARSTERWLNHYGRTCWQFLGWRACRAIDRVGAELWGRAPGWGFLLGLRLNVRLLAAKIGGRVRRSKKRTDGLLERRAAAAPKILCLTQHDPERSEIGASLRARNIFKLLARHGEVRVALATFHQPPEEHPDGQCAGFPLLRTIRFERTQRISLADRVRHDFDPRFANTNWIEARPEDRAWLESAIAAHDLVWVHSLDLANYFGLWRWPHTVLDIDDIPSEYLRSRQRAANGLLEKIHWGWNAFVCRRHEKTLRERFDAVCVCSEADRAVLGWPERTFVVPNGFEPPPGEIVRSLSKPPRVGFIGNFGYEPNRQGAWWFVQNVWPLILKKNPAARLRLVGAEGDKQNWPAGQNIDSLGRVADAAGEMATWNLTVVPIRIGGGTRVKMAEAFSRRCPVVATPLGAYGYDAEDGRDLFIAEDAENFADKCLRILSDDALGRLLAGNAWQKFLQQWTWDAQARRVAAAANAVLLAEK